MYFFHEQLPNLLVTQLRVLYFGHLREGLLHHFVERRVEAKVISVSQNIFASELVFEPFVTVGDGLEVTVN